MAEPTVTEDVPQSVRDAQEKFDAGMGADGNASPNPMLRELRSTGAVHPGWPEMGILDNTGYGPPVYTAYTFDAVEAVFTDNEAFSTRCYEAIVRPLQGPTILELDEPEHQVYRKLHEYALRGRRCAVGKPNSSDRWLNGSSANSAATSAPTWWQRCPCRSRCGSSPRSSACRRATYRSFTASGSTSSDFAQIWTARFGPRRTCATTSSASSPIEGAALAMTWSACSHRPRSTVCG
jgi:hypothetical protein